MTYQEKEKIKAMQQRIEAILELIGSHSKRLAILEVQSQKEKTRSRVKPPPQK